MDNSNPIRVKAIVVASTLVCCLSFAALVLQCVEQRKQAASRQLNAGYRFGPTNFTIDPLVSDVVFSRDAQTREQSIELLIQQANPAHGSQIKSLAKSADVGVQANAIQALEQLIESTNLAAPFLKDGNKR